MKPINPNTVLDQFLAPMQTGLSADAAQKLVDFRLNNETQSRMDELAQKANEGELTEEEKTEYHRLIDTNDMIAILQIKARTRSFQEKQADD